MEPTPSASPPSPVPALDCDTLVIGAGPAGLSAALDLARLRRRVWVLDGGPGRAARIPRSHNYPGFPGGVPGADLLAAIRRQALDHGVRLVQARARTLRKLPSGFETAFETGGSGGTAHSRTVLLATGASDIEPAIPHLDDAVRRGALRYCPVCDGYEVIGLHVGVLAAGADGLHEAHYLRQFTPHVSVFFTAGARAVDAAERERLRQAGIACVEAPIDALLPAGDGDGDGFEVRHGGLRTRVDTMYCALGMRVHSELGVGCGAEIDEHGYLKVDRHQRTRVEGLYAIGDVAVGLNQITVATGMAATAAAAMHLAMGGAHPTRPSSLPAPASRLPAS